MLNIMSIAVNKRVVVLVGAMLAMMAILVLSSVAQNGIFAHPHDPEQMHEGVADGAEHIHYDENDPDMVRDFDSTDPEGARIEWNVRGVDAADFEIDSSTGVLTFKESPDFENPTDRGLNLDAAGEVGNPNFTSDGDFAPNDNNYQITVSATEMWNGSDESLPAKRSDIALTVIVGNVDDPGELTLQWLQPEVTEDITATLTDEDGATTTDGTPAPGEEEGVTLGYTWYTSKVADPEVGVMFHWNVIANQTDATYEPTAADVDKYLWVHVVYTDTQDAANTAKTADVKSDYAVRAAPALGDNGSPDFQIETDTRTVSESIAVGANVGDPVAAHDPDPEDIVTYELDDDIDSTNTPGGDVEFFNVDRASGQLTVAKELDADQQRDTDGDGTIDSDDGAAGEYVVVVRATDPSGVADTITITITAENANEAPSIAGRAELMVDEDPMYMAFETSTETDPILSASEYIATQDDVDDSIATWRLVGADAGAFDLSGLFEPRYLNFKEAPDFENPTDANRDNVYEVTIVATDTDPLLTGAGVGMISVAVVVENVNEAGKAVFTEGETAYLDQELVADVQDPDDHGGDLGEPHEGVHVQTWQWSKWNGQGTEDEDSYQPIDGETTNRYTPVEDDRGNFLRVTATYTDPFSANDVATTAEDERVSTTVPADDPSLRTVSETTDVAVRLAPGRASAPDFSGEGSDGTTTRDVAENTESGDNVGAPVKATGPEGITYLLGGVDEQYFNIDEDSGQITVGDDPDPMLDFEASKNMYNVTVEAKGPDSQTAQIAVTIIVTDVNEPPVVKDGEDDVVDMGVVTATYAEIKSGAPNTDAVATYVAEDPEGQAISWDVRGTDASSFTIDGGILRFVSPPDFENPGDRARDATDMNDDGDELDFGELESEVDNVYNVIVRVITSRVSGDAGPAQAVSFIVNVTVDNVEEAGAIELSQLQPEAAIPITATLTDPDSAAITDATWTWAVSKVATASLVIDNEDHWNPRTGVANEYTPVDADENRILRVTVTYTDAAITDGPDEGTEDDGDTVRFMTMYAVQAEGGGAENQSPDFEDGSVERTVSEHIAVGANVGLPVTASVRTVSPNDTLTYGLRPVTQADIDAITGVDLPAMAGDDADAFAIDQATGQITVVEGLNFESRGPELDRNGQYVVVATVIDPSGLNDSVVVVITAEDENDDPVLTGRAELTIAEGAGDRGFDDDDLPATPGANVYMLDDEDFRAGNAEWRLEGEDAGEFQIIDVGTRTLIFRDAPDYENPADADGDNVYRVTIVVFDGRGGRGEIDVCIAVRNVNEDGEITLVDANGNEVTQPDAHAVIIAQLTDQDGGVVVQSWRWYKSLTTSAFDNLGALTAIKEEVLSDDGAHLATNDSYTPENEDKGFFLHVVATYTDLLSGEGVDAVERTAPKTTDNAVLEGRSLGRPPEFIIDGGDVEAIGREVAENSPAGTYVGAPLLAATDPDEGETTYSLENVEDGDDAKYFALVTMPVLDDQGQATGATVNTRQLSVALPMLRAGTGPGSDPQMDAMYDPVDLNHEIEDEDDRNTFTVVLKASDGAEDDTIMVTITVTDRNEAPSTPAKAEEDAMTAPANNAPEFAAATDTRTVAENTDAGENIGAPVAATDADDDTLTYTLGGDDAASFDIDAATGQLMTSAALDFETQASYTVEVTASDGTDEAMVTVTITVTDVNEDTPLARYDADNDGDISRVEVLLAIDHYQFPDPNNPITRADVLELIDAYQF